MRLSCSGMLRQKCSKLQGTHIQEETKAIAPQATRLGRNDVVLARTHYPTGTPCPLATALRMAGAQIEEADQSLRARPSQQQSGATSSASAMSAAYAAPPQQPSPDGEVSAQASAAAVVADCADQTAASANHLSQAAPVQSHSASSINFQHADGSAQQSGAASRPSTLLLNSSEGQALQATVYGWRMPQQLAWLLGQMHVGCDETEDSCAQGTV